MPEKSNNKKSRVESLLEQNLEYNKKILESVNQTQQYIKFVRIMNAFKILLIIIPIILALIYVPPFLQKVLGVYDEFLGSTPYNILQDYRNGE